MPRPFNFEQITTSKKLMQHTAQDVNCKTVQNIRQWLLEGLTIPEGPHGEAEDTHAWWKVMCLTGVDYFSTLGYQPGIAFLAAGVLSPVATLILVLVTLFAAYPVYSRVAEQSPNGQGSISMLERLFPDWTGKMFVLCLLGFAATDFIITITLSAADGTAHLIRNPFVPSWLHHQVGLTLVFLVLLGTIFLKGFKEAIGIAVFLVAIYLLLNTIVVSVSVAEVLKRPEVITGWKRHLWHQHGSVWSMLGLSVIIFPKLALGLSGFETGVAVMPLISGERIRNAKKLLLTAALIMSVFLIASGFVTTVLIEPAAFRPGGDANGRALAYLAHRYLGSVFGTIYDLSTMAILSFAGASAMAGLLNLVPRYLPRYGMAPDWARASRPLVLVFVVISFVVTLIFHAGVDAQGGAYATGVLMLMSSAAIAVTISFWTSRKRWAFLLISLVFVYTTFSNIVQRPEGIKIAAIFIGLIIATSLISRIFRSTELRIREVVLDDASRGFLAHDQDQVIRLISHRPAVRSAEEYDARDLLARRAHNLSPNEQLLFLEIDPVDSSEFEASLRVTGVCVGRHNILRAISPAVPNAIAAILIHVRDVTGKVPHIYFKWTEGNPVGQMFRFLAFGEGDVPPVTHEVLRHCIVDPHQRPFVHLT
jgi:hypothetical protein